MSLPSGVSTATLTVGVPVTFSGSPVRSTITISPSAFLVHTATGNPLVNMVEDTVTTDGVAAQFTLPHTDQDGFQDENGNAYKNWYYTATIQYQTDKATKPAFTKVFQLAVGQTTVDLDLLPGGAPAMPYTAPIATVLSVNGSTGAVTVPATTDSDVAAFVSGAGPTATTLNATYVPKWKANTAYLAGDVVVNPSGDAVTAKANFTSAASYSSTNWNLSLSYLAGDATGAADGQVATWDGPSGKFKPRPAAAAIRGDMFLGAAVALKQPYTSFGIQATGDSTTTPDTAWFRLLANQVASEYPALTHHYRKWNDTTQDFDRPIVLNTGAAGRSALVLDAGGTRTGVSFDGSTNITGDIDIRMNLNSPDWTPTASGVLASKWTNDASLSWAWYLNTAGTMRLTISATGTPTNVLDKTSTAAVPFADGTEGWVRVTLKVDNGASGTDMKFYTSTDGNTWTQLGTTVTTAGVISLFASTSSYTIGARSSSSSPLPPSTRIYEVQIRDGINGPSVVPYLPAMWDLTIGTGVPTFEGARVCTWVMSAQPGAGIGYDAGTVGYLSDPVRMKKMSPHFNQLVYFFNSSHNEYNLQGNLWAQKYQAWVDAISVKTPLAARIALTQNPRTGANAADAGPKQRRAQMLAWAQRASGIDAIDTYEAFLRSSLPLTGAGTHLIEDGIHPTGDGYIVEKNWIKAELDAALARVTGY